MVPVNEFAVHARAPEPAALRAEAPSAASAPALLAEAPTADRAALAAFGATVRTAEVTADAARESAGAATLPIPALAAPTTAPTTVSTANDFQENFVPAVETTDVNECGRTAPAPSAPYV